MTEREMLLRKIQEHDFALYDTALYLDINPTDRTALSFYREHKAIREKLAAQYTARFGPLTHGDCDGGRWDWSCGPWPWQTPEEA